MSDLQHYGVKGMKWGVRRDRDSGSSGGGQKKITRKENRQMNRAAKQEFYEKKVSTISNEALKRGDNVLVKTMLQGDTYPTVMTGKEFVDRISSGRAFDVKTTEVFARRNNQNEQFELNENIIGGYKKQNFRKPAKA